MLRQQLRDLHGVGGGTFSQVVADAPEGEAVGVREVSADAEFNRNAIGVRVRTRDFDLIADVPACGLLALVAHTLSRTPMAWRLNIQSRV